MRCHRILLKADGGTSKEAGGLTGMCNMSVDSWVKRYKAGGLPGLFTKPGRGRKSIKEDKDKDSVLSAIKANRQRMQPAKAEWEQQSGKKACNTAFKSFFKSLADDISV
jgi:transposase